jgi:uncharacterized membrane protein
MISSGIDDFRMINWQMALLLLIAWFAVFLSSFKGVKSSGKVVIFLLQNLLRYFEVVYVTVILPYIILLVLFARFMTLPGSINGLIHFFKPDWNALKNVQVSRLVSLLANKEHYQLAPSDFAETGLKRFLKPDLIIKFFGIIGSYRNMSV